MTQRRIFIVDDEAQNVAFLREILDGAGYAVDSTEDATGALDTMAADPPDAAFLDVQMPGVNGFQILQAMRQHEALSTVPVILLSAIGAMTGEEYTPDSIEQRYGVRPDAFIPKPIEPDRILETLSELLG